MAYCTQCGNAVADTDIFCAGCGARQQPAAAPPPPRAASDDVTAKVSDRNAAIFCYIPIVGWIWAIVVLASDRFRTNRDMRFHAFQGLYLFVAWLLVEWVVAPMLHFGPGWGMHRGVASLLKLGVMAAWVFMLVKTSQSQMFRLPIIGELADRSVAEQR